jgi:hypothetical protein
MASVTEGNLQVVAGQWGYGLLPQLYRCEASAK